MQCVRVALSGNRKRIVTAGGDKTARVWDATTGALQLELKELAEMVNCAAFSPDGTQIATGCNGEGALVKGGDARAGKNRRGRKWPRCGSNRPAVSPGSNRIATG